jgi:hypothetical protein
MNKNKISRNSRQPHIYDGVEGMSFENACFCLEARKGDALLFARRKSNPKTAFWMDGLGRLRTYGYRMNHHAIDGGTYICGTVTMRREYAALTSDDMFRAKDWVVCAGTCDPFKRTLVKEDKLADMARSRTIEKLSRGRSRR